MLQINYALNIECLQSSSTSLYGEFLYLIISELRRLQINVILNVHGLLRWTPYKYAWNSRIMCSEENIT